ncbi:MAG TPA: MbnP family copper-binding protein [Polyangiaceae bacterium]|nr:MbnP family copper-binding protein [Polyangiaceae bacterium]
MPTRLSFTALILGLSIAALVTGCGNDDDAKAPKPRGFALSFAAVADGKHIGCEDTVEGLGPDGNDSIGLSDLRFYVSNLELWDAAGSEVAFTLDENDFQYDSEAGQVSLIDLTSNTKGSCAGNAIAFAEGTKRTNDSVTGTTVVENVKSVSFDLGVPQAVMKDVIAEHTPEGAPSPLAEMQWTWATGYRHFVMNFAVTDADGKTGDGYVHIGSRDCGPADGLALKDRERCDFVNTPRVSLAAFDLDKNVVTLDVPAALAGLDFVSPVYDLTTFEVIGEGPGVECHSSPDQPDCPTLFDHFGLDIDSGKAKASRNVVFGVE